MILQTFNQYRILVSLTLVTLMLNITNAIWPLGDDYLSLILLCMLVCQLVLCVVNMHNLRGPAGFPGKTGDTGPMGMMGNLTDVHIGDLIPRIHLHSEYVDVEYEADFVDEFTHLEVKEIIGSSFVASWQAADNSYMLFVLCDGRPTYARPSGLRQFNVRFHRQYKNYSPIRMYEFMQEARIKNLL